MTTAAEFKQLALALPQAEEKLHFKRLSFRVRNKIFATLDQAGNEGVVKLPVADQTALMATLPDVFFLTGWAHHGWTGVRLKKISNTRLADLLKTSWLNVAPKSMHEELG